MRKVRQLPRTIWQELVDNLKASGITVTKMTLSNSLYRSRLKSCCPLKVPLLKKSYVQACLQFTNKHQDDSEEG